MLRYPRSRRQGRGRRAAGVRWRQCRHSQLRAPEIHVRYTPLGSPWVGLKQLSVHPIDCSVEGAVGWVPGEGYYPGWDWVGAIPVPTLPAPCIGIARAQPMPVPALTVSLRHSGARLAPPHTSAPAPTLLANKGEIPGSIS